MSAGLILLLGGLSAAAVSPEELQACASIESAVARLDCFDRLARRTGENSDARTREAPERIAGEEESPPVEQTRPTPAPAREEESIADAEFGREAPVPEAVHIRARIDAVDRAPLGQHILTLSNGQVWMENEPGRRPIAAGQEVVIRKHRFHYELDLDGQPDVAVRRLQ